MHDISLTIHRLEHKMLGVVRDLCEHEREILVEELSVPYPPASAPGEAPHLRTGELQAGVDVTLEEVSKEVVVSSQAPYSEELEYGTSKMEARPFVRPSLERLRQGFEIRFGTRYSQLPPVSPT